MRWCVASREHWRSGYERYERCRDACSLLYMQWACIISPRANQETGTIKGRDKIINQFSNSGLRLINLHHQLVQPATRNSHVYVCSSAFEDGWRLKLRPIRFYTVLSSQYLFGIWHKHILFKLYKWLLWKKCQCHTQIWLTVSGHASSSAAFCSHRQEHKLKEMRTKTQIL